MLSANITCQKFRKKQLNASCDATRNNRERVCARTEMRIKAEIGEAASEFGALRDELIRDRIVVGVQDAGLSESLQLDSELRLEKAVIKVRQSEAVKRQQPILGGCSREVQISGDVHALSSKPKQ